jgi:FkbM family methyltransferase
MATALPHVLNLGSRLRNRGLNVVGQSYLSVRLWLTGKPVWIGSEYFRLPFHGDGDRQEVSYFIHGREWWLNEHRLLSPFIKEGDAVLDVGANMGFMAGLFSKLVGASGSVYSFEPSPNTYKKLLEVMGENHLSNVTAYNMGCGRQECSMTLYSPISSGNASLCPDQKHFAKSEQTVRIVRLDDFLLGKLNRLDFLKIDTEGFEDEVLNGAMEILKRFKPVLYIELSGAYFASSERSVELLRDLGYRFQPEVDLTLPGNPNYFAIPDGYEYRQNCSAAGPHSPLPQ